MRVQCAKEAVLVGDKLVEYNDVLRVVMSRSVRCGEMEQIIAIMIRNGDASSVTNAWTIAMTAG